MDRLPAFERNGHLSLAGYGINLLIALSCLGTLIYPFLDKGGIISIDCIFKGITGLPCPTCGYSSAIGCLLNGNPGHSFSHNPFWIFWEAFQVMMVYIGMRSIFAGRQAVIPGALIIPLAVLIILSWVAKFILGPQYY